MSSIKIRAAKKEDVTDLYEMIKEFFVIFKIADAQRVSREQLQRDGFEIQPPLYSVILAEQNGEAVGYAMHYPSYSPLVGRAIFLQNLYVRESYRGHGVGKRLLCSLAEVAVATGCARIDFDVPTWNKARALYERMGCTNLTETEQFNAYRLVGQPLRDAAESFKELGLL